MSQKRIREKKHRLWPELYMGGHVISYTGNVKNHEPLFKNINTYKIFENILLEQLEAKECDAYIYLFMPDHFHFILTGKNKDSNIKGCIDSFKQRTGFWLYKNIPKIKWQKDYYDHILRSEENLIGNIKYILNNPVKSGIVNYWKEYKLKGSTIFNFDNWP